MIQDTNGKTYATAEEFMAEVRRKALERESHRTPPKVIVAREGG